MGKNKIILIVDDDENIRRLIEVAISKTPGFKPVCVENGKEAFEFLKTGYPQAIILDVVMPDMDGYSFLKKARNTPGLDQVPIIVNSAKEGLKKYFDLEDEKMKPDAFLTKPYKMQELIDTLKRFV